MRLLLVFLFLPLVGFAQVATEADIPFTLNSDGDSEINVIDTDDDNDLVLDNDDFLPLDAALSEPTPQVVVVKATHDAGLRSNSTNTANKNYGSDPTIQTKNTTRSFIMKFPVPSGIEVNAATLTVYTDSEDDPMAVWFLPDSDWSESTITFNTTNFEGELLLGLTETPLDGKYTFDIPVNLMPAGGGDLTLWVYDPSDPSNSNENIFTKEHLGDGENDQVGDEAPTLDLEYFDPVTPRLVYDQSDGTSEYIAGDPLELGVSLTQAPSNDVYVPFEISDPSIAAIVGDQVMTFTSSNWNVPQILMLDGLLAGQFDVMVRPLHGGDPFFNGHNPEDLKDYLVQSTDITNLQSWTVATGSTLDFDLMAVSGTGASGFQFSIEEGPSGFNIGETNGNLTFSPLSDQLGVHNVTIKVVDDNGDTSFFESTVTVTDGGAADPTGIIVDLDAEDDPMADGTGAHPFNDIAIAVTVAEANGGGDVLIRGTQHELTSTVVLTTTATAASAVVIKPLPGEHVKIDFDIRTAFSLTEEAHHIEIQGLEIDGGTDEVDFWCIVAQALWFDLTIPRGGGLAITLDGENLTVRDNYIHDCYQKAVEIRGGRYVDVYGNIIHSIATTSISGGHGIMRQQKGREFFDDDVTTDYRWDINGNLIFNVEQRIYSWVPTKGFMEMTLDEGKPILIDDPKDTDGVQEYMSARIKNNAVAYGSIDHIRLKSTPNLEVSNNSIYAESSHADGITDKGGDTDTPQFTNFIFTNNVAHTGVGTTALEADDAIEQAEDDPDGSPTVLGNVAFVGSINPNDNAGIVLSPEDSVYVDALNGNFRLRTDIGLPSTLGVDPIVLDEIDLKAEKFDVEVKWDGWTNDDIKLTQTILDNIPGLNDGIVDNESAFTDMGVMRTTADGELVIDFDVVVGGDFQIKSDAPDTMQFRLNEDYAHWYEEVDALYKNAQGEDYERIRWGCSYLKQDQIFQENWLVHAQITADTNTVIYGAEQAFTIDGDLLVDFEGITPNDGDYYDLIIANTIMSANSGDLFDQVIFEGFTPDDYTIEIVDLNPGQAVRLTIGAVCDLLVTNTLDIGAGSLRDAIDCAVDGDTIILSEVLENDTIMLTSAPLVIDKSIVIQGARSAIYVQNLTSSGLEVAQSRTVGLENFKILSNDFINNGDLHCLDMIFESVDASGLTNFINNLGASLSVDGEVKIE